MTVPFFANPTVPTETEIHWAWVFPTSERGGGGLGDISGHVATKLNETEIC
uniref:Uncharacterized protein n=1 Tax=Rhizophora mucronata TaxID=61149 RepID=A0A2P2PM48_RHIMU